MNYKNEMLEEAIESLSRATEAMQSRHAEVSKRLSEVARTRREFIQNEVKRLLPKLSKNVEAQLIKDSPDFVTASVRRTFAENHKFLGLFTRKGHDSALLSLQAKLARFIESRHERIEPHDDDIRWLEKERAKLDQRLHETNDNLKLMTSTLQRKTPLSPQVQEHITRIVTHARQRKADSLPAGSRGFQSSSRSSYSSHTTHDVSSSSSDGDLWFYMMTDIPTSFRTMMLDSFSSHQNHSNHDNYSHHDHHHHDSDNRSESNLMDSQSSAAAAAVMAFDSASNEAGSNSLALDAGLNSVGSIATDDSLGAFS